MVDFTFSLPTQVVFGKGGEAHLAEYVAPYSKNVLLHYGGKSIKASGLYDRVKQALAGAGIACTELGGVSPNPRLSLVREGIEICRERNINFILAVGGGSVIDSAKAIAAGVPYAGDVWDFFTRKAVAQKALPIGVVLTIPAAGSETGSGTVVTNEAGPDKRSFESAHICPQFALMNPALCYTLPPRQAAIGGADIFAHVLERYFCPNKNNDLSDRLCEGTLASLLCTLPPVAAGTREFDAWAEVMWTGSVAHNGLLGKGREEDWASHNIGHELSALYDIPHGETLSIIFPAWMKYVYKQNVQRFVQYAVRVFGVNLSFEDPEAVALEGIRRTEQFFAGLGLATRLSQLGVGDKAFALMAEKATENGPLGAFMRLEAKDVEEIYRLAL